MSKFISIRGLVSATTVIAALASGSIVLAEGDSENDDMMQVMPFGYGPYAGRIGMMARPVDTDGDGIVSAAEASTHASAAFAQFDADGDGQISEDEYIDSAPSGMQMGRRNVERLYVNRTGRFKGMDADGDGDVTLAEFVAKVQASYEAADADKDGKVTVWEFRSQQNPF
ncbi:EF-hand domain-containing protein [Pseudogemmobacter sp. W21_MBD1_M6]|uniref:EF-hand domain-containing protein n=1 Tax=Pseudogemmobacter sp. W21_MBD1_M6 TaxID=3240271 RepID=UPI003F9D2BE7